MKTLLATLLCFAALSACDGGAFRNSTEGQAYKTDLGHLIRAADHIVVTEHSWRYDLLVDGESPKELPEISYKQLVLTKEQSGQLLARVDGMSSRLPSEIAACVFEPHHRIDFSSAGKSIGSMEICFKCGDVELAGAKSLPPSALIDELSGFISEIGLRPKRDWVQLAKGRRE